MTNVTTNASAVSPTRTVLVLDGHEGVRTALAHRLERAPGLRAVVVADLATALHLAGELLPDAVVCDPKTLATDAAETVRLLAMGGAPVVVFTSTLRDGEPDALARAGAAALLLKGGSIADLIATIDAAIEARTTTAPITTSAQKAYLA